VKIQSIKWNLKKGVEYIQTL